MKDHLAKLRRVGILASLPDAALAGLIAPLDIRKVARGDEVVSLLGRDNDVYFILEGAVRVSMIGRDGAELSFRVLRDGAHFGEIAALTGAPRSAAVTAETDAVLARCPQALFSALLDEHPALAVSIARSLAHTVQNLSDRLFEMAALETHIRVAAELLRIAKDGEAGPEGILVAKAPTQEQIAAAIGAQREAVSREMGRLRRAGVLAGRGRRLVIAQPDVLRAMVEERAGMTVSYFTDWPAKRD